MKVRTFHVKSMHEAIRSIKDTLGPEAVILSTKRVRSWDNGFGLLGGSVLEVMAAVEDDGAIPDPAPLLDQDNQPRPAASSVPMLPAEESGFQKMLQGAMDRSADGPRSLPRQAQVLIRKTGAAQDPIQKKGERHSPIQSFQRVYEDLLAQGVEHATAEGCLRELQATLIDPSASRSCSSLQLLRTVLLAKITAAGPLLGAGGQQKIALFIGPSGVGKTSTIAKLATHYGIVEQRGIALITMDTYRPAAVEQLRLYADVLGIDLFTAGSCDEVNGAIEQAREAELILIDTPGFNPYEPIAAQRWRGLLNGTTAIEAHLVLAAGTRVPDLMVSISRCVDVPSLRLLFTKLDETSGYGGIFEAAHRTGVPLSYWGSGQRVPDDLMPAHIDRLGDLLLGGQVNVSTPAANRAWPLQEDQAILPGIKTHR